MTRTPNSSTVLLAPVAVLLTACGRPALAASPPAARRAAESRVYRLSYHNTGDSDFRALFAGRSGAAGGSAAGLTHTFRTVVEGEWVATPLERGASSRIAYRLRQGSVRLWMDGQEAAGPSRAVGTDLSRAMLVTTDRAGRVRSVRFDPATSALGRNYARTLLGLVQYVRADGHGAGRSWTAEEEDPNGRYVARYERVRQPGDGPGVESVRKTPLRYLTARQPLQATSQEVRPAVRPAGALRFKLDRRTAALLSLEGSERAVLLIRGTTVGHSATTVRLQLARREAVGAAELAALRRSLGTGAGEALSAANSPAASEAAIERRALGSATLERLLAALRQADAQHGSGPPPLDTPLYLKLKALISLHPEDSPRLGALLAAARPDSVTAALLTGALGAVGHAQAQAALATAIRHGSQDPAALARELASLARVPRPTPLAEATMRWEAAHAPTQDVRLMAALLLGTMARNLAGPSPARAARIVDELLRRLETAAGETAVRHALMALGNTASPRALPAISRRLASPSPAVRASAVAALRWIDAPAVDARLTRCLRSDPDAAVRQEAAAALGVRPPTAATVAAQQRAFRAERQEGVRLAVLANLARARRAFPALRAFLRTAAVNDPSPAVRKAAAARAGS